MKAYLALTQNELRLAFRDKQVLFFNFIFPLIFFFLLSAMLHAERGGSTIAVIVTNVLVIGILGNGFFGAGIRAVQEREQNILRRFKVAPISPLPILGASLTTGLLLFIPAILLTVGLARGLYSMPVPDRPVSLLLFLAIAAVAFRADVVEASGKTVMPGLIDVHVHTGAPGGAYADPKDLATEHFAERGLAQYLYSGVTTVKSTGDALHAAIALRKRVMDGDLLGAELYISGPLFTTEGGHGTEYFSWLEGPAKAVIVEQFLRTPASADQAREQVRQLKVAGVDAIKAVLETGRSGMLFARMDLAMFRAVIAEAGAQRLPSSVHTGSARDVEDAVDAGAISVEHGSFSDAIPDALFARMAKNGVAYDPTMSVLEALRDLSSGRGDLLRRSLVQQAVSQKLLAGTSKVIKAGTYTNAERAGGIDGAIRIAQDNLRRAWKAGVPMVTGSDAGNMLVFHGPTVHRELQLWVEAGLPPAVALQAATLNAAKLLRADGRIGLVAPDRDANLLVVDGDPTRDISATERISLVVLKGERVRRVDLFDAAKNPLQ